MKINLLLEPEDVAMICHILHKTGGDYTKRALSSASNVDRTRSNRVASACSNCHDSIWRQTALQCGGIITATLPE